MTYQWDPTKAKSNLRKHEIDFADAVSVFSDDLALTIADERFDEERFIIIGMDALGRILGRANSRSPLRETMKSV